MLISREKFPKKFIPIFMIWVALCNILAIILSIVWFFIYNDKIFINASVMLGVIIIFNVTSIVLLYPLFKMDPIKQFLRSALIWFVITIILYTVFGMFILFIPGILQFFADLWFNYEIKNSAKNIEIISPNEN